MYYLSPTFLDSFRHYQNAGDEWADKARKDLIDRLCGVGAASEAMQKGIDFEKGLCDYCDGAGSLHEGEPLFAIMEEMAGHIRGAERQVHVAIQVSPGITVHGYIDFLQKNTIYDVKTTRNYEFPKYLRNCQHLAYMAALERRGIRTFRYLITDFSGVFVEEYNWMDAMLGELRGRALEFMSYLDIDPEMKEAFMRKAERGLKIEKGAF
jgi:hypothetical protein